jgi:hypothetical protein
MDPNRSKDLYWSSEATDDEARRAAAAAAMAGDRPSKCTSSIPAPTGEALAARSRASVLCLESNGFHFPP